MSVRNRHNSVKCSTYGKHLIFTWIFFIRASPLRIHRWPFLIDSQGTFSHKSNWIHWNVKWNFKIRTRTQVCDWNRESHFFFDSNESFINIQCDIHFISSSFKFLAGHAMLRIYAKKKRKHRLSFHCGRVNPRHTLYTRPNDFGSPIVMGAPP